MLLRTIFLQMDKLNNSENMSMKKRLIYTIAYRILYLMKVTAIIADDLINSVKTYTHSSTITEAITIALKEWIDIHNIRELNKQIKQNPVNINNAPNIRKINRAL